MNETHIEQVKTAPKGGKRQKWIFAFCAVAIVLAVLFACVRTVVVGYADSFVFHGASADAAMASVTGRIYTTEEQKQMAPQLSRWDSFRNSHLEELVSTTAGDGAALAGRLYDQGSQTTVLLLHEFNGSGAGDFPIGAFWGDKGYNLLLPDSRCHGDSEGTTVSYGYREADDLLGWVDWIIGQLGKEQRVIIYGQGMGAATALMAAAALPENVAYLVAESPYPSLKTIAEHTLKTWYRLPSFPFLSLIASKADYELEDVDILEGVEKAKLGVVFLAGNQDNYVPIEMTQAVYDAYPGQKGLVTVDAKHGMLYAVGQEEINRVLNTWENEK